MPTFAVPEALVIWLAVAALAVLGRRASRWRARSWRLLGLAGPLPRTRDLGWLAALALAVLGLARPLGAPSTQDQTTGRDVVLLIDASLSMAATDAVPDRLGVAVESAHLVLSALGRAGDDSRAGLIAFAGAGVVRCPLTSNLGAVADSLERLRPGTIQPGGTHLAAACELACRMLDAQVQILPGRQSIVLISDGEDLAGSLPEALQVVHNRGIVLHAISVGDAGAGHPIPVPAARGDNDGGGHTLTWHRYQGQVVETRRHDDTLRQLALATGGAMLPLGLAEPTGLDRLFAERMAPLEAAPTSQPRPGMTLDRRELAPLTAFGALVAAALAAWPRWPKGRLVGLSMVLGGSSLLISAAPPPPAQEDRSAANHPFVAASLGQQRAALAGFEQEAAARPDDPLPRFNAASILYRLNRFDEAQNRYQEARQRADEALRTRIDFGLGNTALARGNPAEAIAHYDRCLASTTPGPAADAIRADADVNRAYAEVLLAAAEAESDPSAESQEGAESPAGAPDEAPGSSEDSAVEPEPGDRPDPAPDPTGESATEPPADSTPPVATDQPPPLSPEARLDRAVEQVERSRSRRIDPATDGPPPSVAGGPDW